MSLTLPSAATATLARGATRPRRQPRTDTGHQRGAERSRAVGRRPGCRARHDRDERPGPVPRGRVADLPLARGSASSSPAHPVRPSAYKEWVAAHPMHRSIAGPCSAGSRSTGMTQQIPDVLADPLYGRPDSQRDGWLPDDRRGTHAARRRGRRCAPAVARGGRSLRRAKDATCSPSFAIQAAVAIKQVQLVGALGGADRAVRPPGRAARGPGRGESGRQLEPRARGGVVDDRQPRGRALRDRRRLDDGVRRGRRSCFRVRFALATSDAVLTAAAATRPSDSTTPWSDEPLAKDGRCRPRT